jgi:hypothetical protein
VEAVKENNKIGNYEGIKWDKSHANLTMQKLNLTEDWDFEATLMLMWRKRNRNKSRKLLKEEKKERRGGYIKRCGG